MSGTNNDTLEPGPFVPPTEDLSTKDLTGHTEAQLKGLKHTYLLKVSDAEDELAQLEEAQVVRLEAFHADWDGYLDAMRAEIARREKKLNEDKAYLAARENDKAADLKALKKEHKDAKDILVATETLLRDSLTSIKSALKALTKIKTRRKLTEYVFTPDTWLEDDEG